jgi:hypothetical protein
MSSAVLNLVPNFLFKPSTRIFSSFAMASTWFFGVAILYMWALSLVILIFRSPENHIGCLEGAFSYYPYVACGTSRLD